MTEILEQQHSLEIGRNEKEASSITGVASIFRTSTKLEAIPTPNQDAALIGSFGFRISDNSSKTFVRYLYSAMFNIGCYNENFTKPFKEAILLYKKQKDNEPLKTEEEAKLKKAQNAGCASAVVVVTNKNVTYSTLGDTVVFAVGDNGNVFILNQEELNTQVTAKQVITTGLYPSRNVDIKNTVKIKITSNSDIAKELSTNNFRIVAASDGIYGFIPAEKIKAFLEYITKGLTEDTKWFDSGNIAERIAKAAINTSVVKGKPDDIVVVASEDVTKLTGTVVLIALDGISSGYELATEVAMQAVEIASRALKRAVDRHLKPSEIIESNSGTFRQ